ncbi:MAG TPA: TolC family protein [Bacteroidales bacterium]|nr:TolC family protein [Bacteroidales bacterium]HPT52240.1 TolC family protein [Bacteroidales bacterium]
MKKIFAIIIILYSFSASCQTLQLSLKECLRYADENNLTIQSSALDVSNSQIQLSQSKLLMSPTISATASQNFGYSHNSINGGFNLGGNYGINAGITLFNGLNTYNTIKQNQLRVSQAQWQVEQRKNQLHIQIIQAYLTVLMNQELLTYQQNVLTSSREQLIEGEHQYKVGQILESDFILLKSQYFTDSLNIENTQLSISNELLTLRNLLCCNSQQTLSIITPDSRQIAQIMYIPDLQEVRSQAMAYLPELKMKNNLVEIANYDVKIAKSAYYPTLSLDAGINTGYNNIYSKAHGNSGNNLLDNLGESIGLNLNIPIYRQNNTRNSVRMKQLYVNQAEISLKQTELNLQKEIEEYYLSMKKAFNQYTVSDIQQKAYQINYVTYSQKFQYGTITAADLLQQQSNYLNALNNYMQNKYSFLLQKKTLEVYMGRDIEL